MNTTRRGAAIALLALAGVVAAACAPSETAGAPDATATTDGGGEIGVAPQETSDGPAEPSYPDSAQEYAQAVMDAWAGDSPSWLEALTSEGAYNEIFDHPGSPNDDWTFLRCDGAAGSYYCPFTNPDGDTLTVRVRNELVGQAHAATGVQYDPTVYPLVARLYVEEFIEAWQFGNAARMVKLSSSAVVNEVPGAPTTAVTYPEPDCCGGGLIQIKAVWNGSTKIFDVGTTKLGGPNAILDYTLKLGFTQ